MSYNNGIISAPINVSDPYYVMGVGQYNGWWGIGYICGNQHGKINKWARYKPVSLPLVYIKDDFNSNTNLWSEEIISGFNGEWGKSWISGSTYFPALEVPVLSELKDIGSSGIQNEIIKWKYNPPTANSDDFLRLLDFLGYNHYSNCPVSVWMSNNIDLNGVFTAGITALDTSRANGEYEIDDLKKMIKAPADIYVGITIWNKTTGIVSSYVGTTPISSGNDSFFNLSPKSNSLISNGGFGMSVSLGNIIDVYLYLSSSPGETLFDMATKYSAYIDDDSETYKRFTVGVTSIIVNIPYDFGGITKDIQLLGQTYYINDSDYGGDGNIYTTKRRINSIYGPLKIGSVRNSDYSTFRIYLSGRCKGVNQKNEVFYIDAIPSITYFYNNGGTFENNPLLYELNGTENMKFIRYGNFSDAQNQRNGIEIPGCPIYDSIEYNFGDADNKGNLSNPEIKLLCSANSSREYTQINMNSINNNNIILKE